MIDACSWHHAIGSEKEQPYFLQLQSRVSSLRKEGVSIYPPQQDVFNAFRYTPLESLKAVIIGQDPYHGPGQAHGLCFSVNHGITPPPSLKNIFKALDHDLGLCSPQHGCLEKWAQQGVLLLNTVLTVEHGKAHSHASFGWETFTDQVIRSIDEHVDRPIVYLLWGRHATQKSSLISNEKHLILKAPHPSPLSAHRGFIDCKHFSKTNEWLEKHGISPINWRL